MGDVSQAVAVAAERLRTAQRTRQPCPPVRDLLGDQNIADAYAVQTMNNESGIRDGRRPIGWKIGLTSEAVQRQLGVAQPDLGLLFADTEAGDDIPTPFSRVLQGRVEAEVAFVLDDDLPDRPVSAAEVMRATAFVLPAIEIVDSRITNWDISIVDTIADNASSGMYVLGGRPVLLSAVDLRQVRMEMTNGGGEIVSKGTGAACLGHPVNAVVWLADTLARLGSPLRAGDLVLSGAIGPMANVQAGGRYEATITGLGSVRARFEEAAE